MPKLDKAERRDKERMKRKKMVVDGRGLITSVPDFERRLEKKWDDRKRKQRDK